MIGFSILFAFITAHAEILVWVSPPLDDPASTGWLPSFHAACGSETRNGQPLLGLPLFCNSTIDIRSQLLGHDVVTPQDDEENNLAVGLGDTLLSNNSGPLLGHSLALSDGTPAPFYVWTGCDHVGQRHVGNDCDDFTVTTALSRGSVGNASQEDHQWVLLSNPPCDLTTTLDIRVYCHVTLPSTTTSAPTSLLSPSASPTTSSIAPSIAPTTASPSLSTTSPSSPSTSSPTSPSTASPTSPSTSSPTPPSTTTPTASPSPPTTSAPSTTPTTASPTITTTASPTTDTPTAAPTTPDPQTNMVSEAASLKIERSVVAVVACIMQLLLL